MPSVLKIFPRYAPDDIFLVYSKGSEQRQFGGREPVRQFLEFLSNDDWAKIKWSRVTVS